MYLPLYPTAKIDRLASISKLRELTQEGVGARIDEGFGFEDTAHRIYVAKQTAAAGMVGFIEISKLVCVLRCGQVSVASPSPKLVVFLLSLLFFQT